MKNRRCGVHISLCILVMFETATVSCSANLVCCCWDNLTLDVLEFSDVEIRRASSASTSLGDLLNFPD